MILHLDDWVFDIDMERTMAYSAAEAAEHCDCAYCRNFYAAVDSHYPNLRPFLGQFGIDIEAPDEQMPYDLSGQMCYDSVYMVCGQVMEEGKGAIGIDGVEIKPVFGREMEDTVHINHGCPGPNFVLDISTILLPWVLDEPLEHTVSPANFPAFLQRMWQRIIMKADKTDISS